MEHLELSTKEVAEILNLSAPYVTALVKKGKLKAHPRQSGGWCGNPGYGYFYQDWRIFRQHGYFWTNRPSDWRNWRPNCWGHNRPLFYLSKKTARTRAKTLLP